MPRRSFPPALRHQDIASGFNEAAASNAAEIVCEQVVHVSFPTVGFNEAAASNAAEIRRRRGNDLRRRSSFNEAAASNAAEISPTGGQTVMSVATLQ